MAKFPTFPILFDDCLTISISILKCKGFIECDQWKAGVITWNRNGNKIASIGFEINTSPENSYIDLHYTNNNNPVRYTVQLVSIPSNIGKGIVWYFICPQTGKRCRKLHLINGYFYHRSAFRGCMYQKQTQSHKTRNWLQHYEKYFEAFDRLNAKHFKKKYNGKPTKRYLKLTKRIEAAEEIFVNCRLNQI